MTEQELRTLVRTVIAQRGEHAPAWQPGPAGSLPDKMMPAVTAHASHALFVIPSEGGACLIEPAVSCNHCGYCKSYGH